MAFPRAEQRLLEEERQKKLAELAKKRRLADKTRLKPGMGVLKRGGIAGKMRSADPLAGLPIGPDRETAAIDQIISERSEGPISREAATKQFNQEQASQAKSSRQRELAKQEVTKQKQLVKETQTAKKGGMSATDRMAAAQLAGQVGGGAGNIASGALAGSAFGPVGIAAGAGLGVIKNLAERERKKKRLKAEGIKGQAAALQKSSEEEQAALRNMLSAFQSALTFQDKPWLES